MSLLPSDPLRLYLLFLVAFLLLAGLVVGAGRLRKAGWAEGAWKKYLGWFPILLLFVGPLFWRREAFLVAVALISVLGFREFAKMTGLAAHLPLCLLVVATIGALTWLSWIHWYGLFMAVPVYAIALAYLVPVLQNRSQGMIQQVSLSIVGIVYFAFFFGHLGFLANAGADRPEGALLTFLPGDAAPGAPGGAWWGAGIVLYVFSLVELNDVFGWASGKLLGRHRPLSNISPNKTLEGFLGSMVLTVGAACLLRFLVPALPLSHAWRVGLLVSLGGWIGDLSISLIKRDVGVKDAGLLLPGHGGFLDRFDSILVAAPLCFHYLRYYFHPFVEKKPF